MHLFKFNLKSIIVFLSLALSLFITYKSYNFRDHGKIFEVFIPFWTYLFPVIFFLLFISPVIYWLYQQLRSGRVFKLRLGWVLLIYIFMITLLVLIKTLTIQLISIKEIPLTLLILESRILLVFLYLGIHTVIWYLVGKKIITLMKLSNSLTKASQILTSILLGLIIFTFGLLILSLFGLLTGMPIIIWLLIMGIFGSSQIRELLSIGKYKIHLSGKIPFNSVIFWMLVISGFQSILSFSILLAPAPMAFDSLSYYFNLAKELGTSGRFVLGQYSMPIELLYGSGFALTRFLGMGNIAELITMHWVWWVGIFGFVSLYYLGCKFSNKYVGILAAATFYTMPLIGFYMSTEPNSAIFVVPIFSVVAILFIEWIQNKTDSILYLIAILLGFVFTIKITHLFGVIAFALATTLYLIITKQWRKILKIIGIGLLGLLVISAPWFLIHIKEQNLSFEEVITRIEHKQFQSTFLTGRNPYRWGRQIAYNQLDNTTGASSGYGEDYQRYLDQSSTFFGLEKIFPDFVRKTRVLTYIKIPWNITAVELIPTLHFMISPFYLSGFVPIIAYLHYLTKHKKEKNRDKVLFVTFLGLSYFIIWWIYGKSVIWYGIGMFAPLGILASLSWDKIFLRKNILIVILANVIVIIPLLMGIYIQLSRFGNKSVLSYGLGKISQHEAMRQLTGNYIDIADTINSDPEIIAKQKYVILGGSFLHYFINNYYQVVLNDIWLDYINTVMTHSQGDADIALQTFQQMGVKYIVINLGTVNQDRTETKSLTKKFDTFMKFASLKLNLITFNQEKGIMLLQVPQQNN